MKVVIDSIEISGVNRWNRIEAEIEFNDNAEVLQEFGIKECLDAFEADDFLNEIGWNAAEGYFSDEIQAKIDEAVTEAKKDAADEIAQLEARIAELEA